MSPQHPHAEAWQFIGQALIDHANTLQPAAAQAFQAVAQQHYNALAPVVLAPIRKSRTKPAVDPLPPPAPDA